MRAKQPKEKHVHTFCYETFAGFTPEQILEFKKAKRKKRKKPKVKAVV